MKNCPYCGNQIKDDAAFCPFCGNQLGQADSANAGGNGYAPQPNVIMVAPSTIRGNLTLRMFRTTRSIAWPST